MNVLINKLSILGILILNYSALISQGYGIETNYTPSPITKLDLTEKQKAQIHGSLNLFPMSTQIAIGIVHRRKISFHGFRKTEKNTVAIDNSMSVFEIGSLTKIFTSTILADFVIDGKLSLEDDITKHLGFEVGFNDEISFVSLANHSSGLPRLPTNLDLGKADPTNPYKDYDAQKLKEYLERPISFDNKKNKYTYSNLGAGLLAYTLKEIASSSFENLYEKYIFKKYGLTQSYISTETEIAQLVKPRDQYGKTTSHWDMNAMTGAGAVLSTIKDLCTFLDYHLYGNTEVLALTRKETFQKDERISMGLGWSILNAKNKEKIYWHGGGTGGFTSYVLLSPESDIGIVILSNVSAFHQRSNEIEQLSFKLYTSIKQNELK